MAKSIGDDIQNLATTVDEAFAREDTEDAANAAEVARLQAEIDRLSALAVTPEQQAQLEAAIEKLKTFNAAPAPPPEG